MANGLIQQQPQQQPEAPIPQAPIQQGAPEGAPQYKSKASEAVPQEMRADFERFVLAGMKFLYSKEMKAEIERQLAAEQPMWQKLGEGIARLVAMLDNESKKTMPQEIAVPIAIELISEFAQFLNESGAHNIPEDEVQQAIIYGAIAVAKLYGATDDQARQMLGEAPSTPPSTPPGAPPQPGAQPGAPMPQPGAPMPAQLATRG